MTRTRKALAAALAAPVIAIGGAAACNSGSGPESGEGAPPPPAAAPAEQPDTAAERHNDPDERDDVTNVELDNRSEYGMDDFWITYKVENDSQKTSDYVITFDVTDPATGERVGHEQQYVMGVSPGQTVSEEMPVFGPQDGSTYELKMKSVERTEAF